jgi:hypothetical protein
MMAYLLYITFSSTLEKTVNCEMGLKFVMLVLSSFSNSSFTTEILR